MAYTGFISDPDYTKKNENETITGSWTFKEVINGTALNAKWADLAEIYEIDEREILTPGTLIKFGGIGEITKTKANDRHFFSVISTKPGIILNKKNENKGLKIALMGQVPCRAIGEIHKFDKLTTSRIPGVAKKMTLLDRLLLKPVVGIALKTNLNKKEKLVDIFVKASL